MFSLSIPSLHKYKEAANFTPERFNWSQQSKYLPFITNFQDPYHGVLLLLAK
jgi:hypothetical protein